MDAHLSDGHLGLSGLQLRGHAMFSDEGLPVDSETLEYAWLLDLQMGVLSGRLTPPQVLPSGRPTPPPWVPASFARGSSN